MREEDVAAKLGVSQSYVHDYEEGQKRLDRSQLQRIAHALGTTRYQLLVTHARNAPPEHATAASEPTAHPPEADESEWESVEHLDPDDHAETVRLGRHLRRLRKAAGLTQTRLGKLVDKFQSTVSNYERAKRRLDIIELEQVATALGTTLLDIEDALDSPPE